MGCSINALSFLRYENTEIVVGNAMGWLEIATFVTEIERTSP
jgi:hypothetical protein